jgi:glycosyltransferase involved in cell wall biosynthesis
LKKQVIKAVHFLNSAGGGTLSVVQNILRFSKNVEVQHHVIYTVNKAIAPQFKAPGLTGAASEQVFFYSANWNFYYTCRRLANLLPSSDAVLVAHDWVELGMASTLGLQNPLVYFLHGNYSYYYDLAIKHEQAIDEYIAVSPVIKQELVKRLPGRINDIEYCRFPVPHAEAIPGKSNQLLKLIFCARDLNDRNKCFDLLPKVNQVLKENNCKVHWTIVGAGSSIKEVARLMNESGDLNYYTYLPNPDLLLLMQEQDLLILPSVLEGFPVVVVEAMKAGVLPLISNWKNATAELVKEGETGFYFETGDHKKYAERIIFLDRDRASLKSMAEQAVIQANKLFNPESNTQAIESAILRSRNKATRTKRAQRVYGSRLDRDWVPNIVTSTIRQFSKTQRN